jgi:hypothetical protein
MCAPLHGSHRCNTAAAHVVGETAVRIPSKGTVGSAAGDTAVSADRGPLAFRHAL